MITEKQLKERTKHLGSSDIAALFNLDPFKNASDVWVSKTFETEKKDVENKSMTSGIRWEPYLIEWAGNELCCKPIVDPDMLWFICEAHPIFASNLDAFYLDPETGNPTIIEAKKTRLWAEWGEQGTDQMPHRVNLQVHTQMLCTGFNTVYVAAMIQGEEQLFKVNRDERIIRAIIETGEKFWNNHVLTKVPPVDCEPAKLEFLKRIRREPETWAEVSDELVSQWEQAKEAEAEAKKKADLAQRSLLTALGDAEGSILSDYRELTYFQQERPEHVVKASKCRVLRIRKGNEQ
ncbi:MAG: YqaJ viral recombinase family protein [Candidatus Omnitrophica bacterium]|nr:YqaJ viral recombinase family protein [Candidatus Omnitrophota bacterium]